MKLTLNKISKTYGELSVLHDISLTLTPGIYGVLGANGAGKTTLFRILCGLMQPSSGEVLLENVDIRKQALSYRSSIGFLPQDFCCYPEFTGLKFMLYIAALKGLQTRLAKKRCDELLALVGLEEAKHKKIKKYSGGMRQRLGIAQALINDPQILILDEPTASLDPKERVRFRKLISSFSKEKIVILSTHIVTDIEYIANEIIVLKKGSILHRGTSIALLQTLEHNVWECIVKEEDISYMEHYFTVSNRKQEEEKIILRIVSEQSPMERAVQVKPTLEDLYLYYFREEENQYGKNYTI